MPLSAPFYCLLRHFFAAFLFEQHIVGTFGVEGGVEVNQVYTLIGDVLAQNGQVVTIEQGILGDRFHKRPFSSSRDYINSFEFRVLSFRLYIVGA